MLLSKFHMKSCSNIDFLRGQVLYRYHSHRDILVSAEDPCFGIRCALVYKKNHTPQMTHSPATAYPKNFSGLFMIRAWGVLLQGGGGYKDCRGSVCWRVFGRDVKALCSGRLVDCRTLASRLSSPVLRIKAWA